eukprot:TRINITY_DN9653_c0_g1_i2.p1 TRINITY_DN9653_c0_g1~~TRINITY_DN9653_c0_g1_i2.p1  ORF type:complete len:144 (-),score=37.76 TRINITY_DN9653_c0_g1_i2:97-528(-)
MKEHFPLVKAIQEKRALYKEEFLKKIGESENDLLTYTGFLTHCADLSGQIKPYDISSEWSKRVSKEFSAQYEEEKKLGLPLSPFMAGLDSIHNIAKQEIGFIRGIIKPMWVECNECMNGEIKHLIENIERNSEEWAKVLANHQ